MYNVCRDSCIIHIIYPIFDSEEELCAYCKYPVIRKVCKETHPQPTMLATVLYVGSMLLTPAAVSLESIYSTVEQLHKVRWEKDTP